MFNTFDTFDTYGNIESYNKFVNLDSIETRIIDYLRNDKSKEAERLWKLLKYTDSKALYKNELTSQEKKQLVFLDKDETEKRVFNFRMVEDNFNEVCSILKIYIHSIKPDNHLISTVGIGIDILSHNKISNVYNDDGDVYEGGRIVEENVSTKNRATLLLKCILSILNGADVEGVGTLKFDQKSYPECQVRMKLSNNRNYYGYELVMSTMMAGDSNV